MERAGSSSETVRNPPPPLASSKSELTNAFDVKSYEEFVVEGEGVEVAQDEEGDILGLEMFIMMLLDFVQCLLTKVRYEMRYCFTPTTSQYLV